MTKVWILDLEGYDARGGNAEVYASLEGAMAAVPEVEFVQRSATEWVEKHDPKSLADIWTITEVELHP